MALSTNLISGLVTGFDWRTMIDQLIAIEYERVETVENRKNEYETKLTEWQSVNSMLLSLKTAADAINAESDFNVYTASTTSASTTAASDIFTVSTSSSASPGMYTIEVEQLAKSQKLSSGSYSATNTALSLSEGDILVGGKVVNIASTDTLDDIKDKINGVNTGSSPSNVTANIVQYGTNDYRLVLTNDDTGADGISLLDASSSDILGQLGFVETASDSYEVKNSITGGAQSDRFANSNDSIEDLLDLNTAQSSTTLTIKDASGTDSNNISVNLANDDLNAIALAINNNKGGASISASVVSETVSGTTYYRLQIDGIHASDPFSDNNNVFETLGLIKGGVGNVVGDTGTNAMTTDGEVISATTVLADIDGYLEWTSGDKIVFSGDDTSGTAINGGSGSYDFSITASTTVQDLLDDIETQYGDVTASVTGDGKIQIVDNTTDTKGSSNLSVTFTAGANISKGDLDFGFSGAAIDDIRNRQLVAGLDARIVVDNQTITNSSNTITTVLEGVTLNLVGEEDGTNVTLKIERDLDAIKSKITDLKDAYNEIMAYINTQFSYDEENEKVGGVLFGDGTLSSVKSELINTVNQTISELPSDYNALALIGITLDLTNTEEGKYEDLTMVIDDDDLTDALESNFNDVRNLFIAYGSSSNPNIEYIGHTDDTVGGTYNVGISQEATRTTVTGTKTLAGGATVSTGVTVTITDYATDRQAKDVDLGGLDLTGVINALNSEFAKEYTEKLMGSQENAGVTTSTLFNDANVGGSDDDVITFSGTRRNGIYVSGSYTIDDASTETVGDLLESIEDMFEDEVTAALDGDGKLVITDKLAGDSQLSFSIDTSALDTLNFGTVNTTNTGAVVGRYAMTITASEGTGGDDDKLVLTHNNYGTGQPILTESSGGSDPLGLNDDTNVFGKDVAGTINGVTATGSGQTLTLDSDDNNADGLSISYSGTTTTSTTFTLSLGIAELLDRQLGFITDDTDGYVSFKQTSLQNSIDSHEDQIEDMKARLDLKMERMINQFVAMELAMSDIQTQSDWLTGQITASLSGWSSL